MHDWSNLKNISLNNILTITHL